MGVQSGNTDIAKSAAIAKAIPGGVIEGLSEAAKQFSSPVQSFRESPLSMLLNVASVAVPAARGAFSMRSAPSVARAAASSAAPGLGKRVFAKGIKTAFGPTEEAVLARMENPARVKTAFSAPELADQMTVSMKNFDETIKEFAGKAAEKLRSSPYIEEGATPKTDILNIVKNVRKDIGGAYTPDVKAASKALKDIETSLKTKLKSTVSETQIKGLIQQLDENINWGNPAASKSNKALIGIRTRLDGIIKKQNTGYTDAMKPVDEAMRVKNRIQNKFGIEYETAKGYYPTDQSTNKIRRSLAEDKIETQDLLGRFEKITGEDWQGKIKFTNAKESFEKPGRGMGSTRANVGAVAGSVLGLPGAVAGTVAGMITDVYGPRVAAKIIDAVASPKFARYSDILSKASQGGARNLAAVQTVLMEKDPEFRKAILTSRGGTRQTQIR
jgi:hypothetical protein